MKKVLAAAAAASLAAGVAWSQENIFSTNTGGNTVSVSDAQTFQPLPTIASEGPNQISTGANSAPRSIFYEPGHRTVYAVNSSGASVTAIDPILMTTTTVQPTGAAGPFSEGAISQDGRWLFVGGLDTGSGKYGVFQYDLDNFSVAGAKFIGGLTLTGSGAMIDVEVLPASATGGAGNGPGRVYFTISETIGGVSLVIVPHVGEVNLLTNTVTDLPLPVTGGPNMFPKGYARMTRSPDNAFVLIATTSGSAISPNGWQVARINPAVSPEIDFFLVPTLSANEVIDDIAFTTAGAPPFTVCMLARDDSTYKPQFFTVGATGGPSNFAAGQSVPSQFGGEMTPDLAHNRIFVAWNGNTSTPNGIQVYSPPTPAGTFAATAPDSGGPGPQKVCVAPAPPPMSLDSVVEPAGISTSGPFQLELHGTGFIQGSSRARLLTAPPPQPTGFATTTTVIDSGTILATFPTQASATIMHVGVLNNDGQSSVLFTFFQGMNNPPGVNPFPVPIPPMTSGYSMLSFPQYGTVGDLRAGISSQLGGYDPRQVRFFLWQQNGYVELNDPGLSPAMSIMGTGFFGLTRYGATLTLSAPDVTENTTGGQRVVVLSPGWNIISQPWTNPPAGSNSILWTNVQVSSNRDLSLAGSAAGSTLISNVVFEYVGGQYQATTQLTAGNAYWALNNLAAPIFLIFPQVSVFKPGPVTSPSPSPLTPPAPPGQLQNDSTRIGCGLAGLEFLIPALFLRAFRRRRPAAGRVLQSRRPRG